MKKKVRALSLGEHRERERERDRSTKYLYEIDFSTSRHQTNTSTQRNDVVSSFLPCHLHFTSILLALESETQKNKK